MDNEVKTNDAPVQETKPEVNVDTSGLDIMQGDRLLKTLWVYTAGACVPYIGIFLLGWGVYRTKEETDALVSINPQAKNIFLCSLALLVVELLSYVSYNSTVLGLLVLAGDIGLSVFLLTKWVQARDNVMTLLGQTEGMKSKTAAIIAASIVCLVKLIILAIVVFLVLAYVAANVADGTLQAPAN